MSGCAAAVARLEAGEGVTREGLAGMLSCASDETLPRAADRVRRRAVGEVVHLRAIVEFSNICRRRCAYCGLGAGNTALPRYRMQPREVAALCRRAYAAGYRTVVLQSGEDPFYTCDMVCQMVGDIKGSTGLAVTLSIGERPREELRAFREAGADRYLLKHETSDPALYASLHPEGTLGDRLKCLETLKELRYEVGGGFMVGLPGQAAETLADDLLLLGRLGCDMAGIGPFLPHPRTPLGCAPPGSATRTLRAVAAARLLLPQANLPATTALGVRDGAGPGQVFDAGANVLMRKVTPWPLRRQYEIYPADLGEPRDLETDRRELEAYVRSLGREPR